MTGDDGTLATAVHHIQAKIAAVIVGAVLLGISSLLLCFSTYIFAQRGLRIWSYLFLLITTVAMYIVASTYWAIETTTLLLIIYFPDAYAIQSPTSLDHKSLALTVCLGLNIWFSDVIVLWRTWVLWQNMLPVRVVSATIFVGITGVLLADVTTTRAQLHDYTNNVAHLPIAFRNLFGGIGIFLSFGFNIWATMLAGIKAWQYVRTTRRSGTGGTGTTRQSLALLLECGALYIVLWAAFIAFSAFRNPSQSPSLSYALDQAVVQISAIYPTVIVVLVSLHKVKEDAHGPALPVSATVLSGSSASDGTRFRPLSHPSVMGTGNASSMYLASPARSGGVRSSVYTHRGPSTSMTSTLARPAAGGVPGKEDYELSPTSPSEGATAV
ncbi:hypothetical protein K488DRAFT_69558 [Vararia minispora EC-137]|uniref:Uncharacterized protein n=1 Tax=Vararia minispora EC-137 TaxID=1314806 RepID=A0ACB8QQQ0_9AGAM|nr:hypothetical protein K488DRAFT_69558 [Vararia minispora EC-137]